MSQIFVTSDIEALILCVIPKSSSETAFSLCPLVVCFKVFCDIRSLVREMPFLEIKKQVPSKQFLSTSTTNTILQKIKTNYILSYKTQSRITYTIYRRKNYKWGLLMVAVEERIIWRGSLFTYSTTDKGL